MAGEDLVMAGVVIMDGVILVTVMVTDGVIPVGVIILDGVIPDGDIILLIIPDITLDTMKERPMASDMQPIRVDLILEKLTDQIHSELVPGSTIIEVLLLTEQQLAETEVPVRQEAGLIQIVQAIAIPKREQTIEVTQEIIIVRVITDPQALAGHILQAPEEDHPA